MLKLQESSTPKVHRSGSASDMTPEKRLLYEIIVLFLGASPQHKTRKFTSSPLSVSEMKKNIKTENRRNKLEAKTKEAPECSVGKLLNSLLCSDVEGDVEQMMSDIVFNEDRETDESPDDLHVAIDASGLINIWNVGNLAIIDMKPKEVREDAERRHKQKYKVARFIIDEVNKLKTKAADINVGYEMNNNAYAPWINYMTTLRMRSN